ncbi:MAG TPA: ATP-binding cassette domain-containing protein [Actinocrinis sp.]|jgi:ABC-2 type transport system ATP-binding protein
MIEAQALTKRYGTTVAVDDLSFSVRPGRVTGFLGPNGAGKSTTMRMIVGLDLPTSGAITVGGHAYRELRRPLHHVGALLEARAWHSGRSAYNHLLCLAQSNGIGRRRVGEVLDLVGLAGVARRRAGGFSLGMGQRLGIAAALLGDPPVIVCDEPVNGLDPEGISWIRGLLRSLAAQGRTVLVSSHLMSEMALTADHLIVIGRGRLVADASIADVIAAGPGGHVEVRTPQPEEFAAALRAAGAHVAAQDEPGTMTVIGLACAQIGDIATERRLTIHGLAQHGASLEAAYLELTRDSTVHRHRAAAETGALS